MWIKDKRSFIHSFFVALDLCDHIHICLDTSWLVWSHHYMSWHFSSDVFHFKVKTTRFLCWGHDLSILMSNYDEKVNAGNMSLRLSWDFEALVYNLNKVLKVWYSMKDSWLETMSSMSFFIFHIRLVVITTSTPSCIHDLITTTSIKKQNIFSIEV